MVEIQEQSSPHTVQDLRVTDWPLKSPEHPHLTAGSGSGRGEGLGWMEELMGCMDIPTDG